MAKINFRSNNLICSSIKRKLHTDHEYNNIRHHKRLDHVYEASDWPKLRFEQKTLRVSTEFSGTSFSYFIVLNNYEHQVSMMLNNLLTAVFLFQSRESTGGQKLVKSQIWNYLKSRKVSIFYRLTWMLLETLVPTLEITYWSFRTKEELETQLY